MKKMYVKCELPTLRIGKETLAKMIFAFMDLHASDMLLLIGDGSTNTFNQPTKAQAIANQLIGTGEVIVYDIDGDKKHKLTSTNLEAALKRAAEDTLASVIQMLSDEEIDDNFPNTSDVLSYIFQDAIFGCIRYWL